MIGLMTKKTKKHKTGCPVAFGLDTFGDRWSLIVIREIMLAGKRTYSEFLEAEEGIASNILIDRLETPGGRGHPDQGTRPPTITAAISTA